MLGQVEGRLVDADGAPAPNLNVLCCTLGVCYAGGTDEDGRYFFDDLEPGPKKMQVVDTTDTFVDMIFYQDVPTPALHSPGADVVLTRRTGAPSAWPVQEGGQVVLAGGALELVAEPGSVKYPSGLAEEALLAQQVPAALLPPYDQAPWSAAPDRTTAFLLDPLQISASSPVTLRVRADGEGPGARFTIWSADSSLAVLQEVGGATVDAEGWLVSDEDAQITELTALVLVPRE